MKKSNLILLTLLSTTLFSCGGNDSLDSTESSSAQDEIVDVLPDGYTNSVKDYLKALKSIHNYTISETVSSTAATYENYIVAKYDTKSYYYDFGSNSYGYIQSDDGVYAVNIKNDSLIGGEIYHDDEGNAYKDLWGHDFFKSFASLDEEQLETIPDGTVDVSLKGKKNKLAILSILGLDSSYYAGIASMKASISSSNALGISIEIEDSSGATITVDSVVYALLTTKNTEIDEFLANGGTYYVIDSDFAKARTLMKGNNYTHNYYYNKKIVGVEYFNENYYFVNWDSSYVAETGQILVNQGLIGIDHKKDSNGNALNGAYLVTLNNGQFSISLSFYYNEDPNIPTVYHYPSLMYMWDNPEFFEMDETPSDLDAYFTTDDTIMMNNFIENFSMSSQVADVNVRSLSIGWKDIEDDSNTSRIVRFCLSTSGGDVTYDFCNFGTTNIPAFDSFLAGLSDQ